MKNYDASNANIKNVGHIIYRLGYHPSFDGEKCIKTLSNGKVVSLTKEEIDDAHSIESLEKLAVKREKYHS